MKSKLALTRSLNHICNMLLRKNPLRNNMGKMRGKKYLIIPASKPTLTFFYDLPQVLRMI